MTYEQIKRKGVVWQQQTYGDIIATNNLVSVTNFHGSDLEIVEKDKYCYIMTYSFPCQDLSVAGKQKGMSKDSGTRSGLLWEVERILNECDELPQILLMENVTQVHGKKNIADFELWCKSLENMGYTNFWKDCNAKKYGVPQNRDRTFMVSILGEYDYVFPKEIELKHRLKDVIEKEVDEKFYISTDKVKLFQLNGNVNPSGKGRMEMLIPKILQIQLLQIKAKVRKYY